MSRQSVDDLLDRTLQRARRQRRLPESTYRLQFHAGFTFRDASAVVPYLAELGITHVYASPYLAARPGSTHGYDIIDHCRLNPELGTRQDFEAFLQALDEQGMSHILDVVPNHVGVATNENTWWNDVLENGPASRYGAYFDIAWRSSPRPELHDKVLIPTLGQPYAQVLEQGQFRLAFDDHSGAFCLHYYERRFPISPRTYGRILEHRLDQLQDRLGAEDPALMEYLSILTATRHLPHSSDAAPAAVEERHREKEVIKHRLAALAGRSGAVRDFLEQNLAAFNGRPGDPGSFDLLDALLERQPYRLSYWHVASDEINYRRFFDINDLAALAMERREVFEQTHELVGQLLGEGRLAGLRIDHPDGLYDPAEYFLRLQRHYLLWCAQAEHGRPLEPELREGLLARIAELEGPGEGGSPLYVVAEKILAIDEPLPTSWAVHGTSGYDFLNLANGLFIETTSAGDFSRIYNDWTGRPGDYDTLVYRNKLLILRISLASELHMLAHQLDRLAQRDRHSRDFTLNGLTEALRQVIACFGVYRSYITAREGVSQADEQHITQATERAIERNPKTDASVFHFIRDALLQKYPEGFTAEDKAEQLRFAGKFQQVTAPVTAKGIEDTTFYQYNRFISLNEVGGEPDHFGTAPDELHRLLARRQAQWPHALSALSTHDTKRSEDVRARLNVLSELSGEWEAYLKKWDALNTPHRRRVRDQAGEEIVAPDRNDEYLLYQTLIGAWPIAGGVDGEFVERIQDYMQKALREAKRHTSWTEPNQAYEQAVGDFVAVLLDEGRSGRFRETMADLNARIRRPGMLNSLSQALLKLTAPGAPDTYQGTELWDQSLVDPDNRRPVGYDLRRRLLAELMADGPAPDDGGGSGPSPGLLEALVQAPEDGRVKLYMTAQVLRLRRRCPGLLSKGEYLPLEPRGERSGHVFSFARRHEGKTALVILPRLMAGAFEANEGLLPPASFWGGTAVVAPASGTVTNLFTGKELAPDGQRQLSVAEVLKDFPVAVLVSE